MTHYQKTVTLVALNLYRQRALDELKNSASAGGCEIDPLYKYWLEELKETNIAIEEVQMLQAWDGEFPK